MTPAEIAADSFRSWRYAIACLRAEREAGRPLPIAQLMLRADRIIAEEARR